MQATIFDRSSANLVTSRRALKIELHEVSARSSPSVALISLVLALLSVVAQVNGEPATPRPPAYASCLPARMKLSDIVEAPIIGTASDSTRRSLTVGEKLDQLRATCDGENKLMDGSGRPIVFRQLIGCWGNPPPDYLELLEKQRVELQQLKERNTVVEMTCNPSGVRIH